MLRGAVLVALVAIAACSGDDATPGTGSGSGAPASEPSSVVTRPRPPLPDPPTMQEEGFDYTWAPVRMGAGGFVTGLVIHPDGTKLARTDVGGAYRYDDDLHTWTQLLVADRVPDPSGHSGDFQVESIAVSPQDVDVVYLSAGDEFNPGAGEELERSGRVLSSTDGGRTWTASSQGFFISGNQDYRWVGERLGVDPADSRHVLLGTRREGLWDSRDGGATWTQIPPDQVPISIVDQPEDDQPGITFVSFDADQPQRAYVGVAGEGVYRSDDSGATWQSIADLGPRQIPTQGDVVGGRLHVGYRSASGRGTGSIEVYDPASGAWTDLTPPEQSSGFVFAVDPSDPQRMVAGRVFENDFRLFHSLDGGTTWTAAEVSDESPDIPWVAPTTNGDFSVIGRLAFDPTSPGTLWWADGVGVYRVDDITADPVTPVLDSVGIEQLVVAEMVAPPGGDLVSAVADFQGFVHPDLTEFPTEVLVDPQFAGGTDIDYSGGQPQELVWVAAEYQRTEGRTPRGAYSSDGGSTWTELPNLSPEQFGGEVAVSATDPENIVWLPSYSDWPTQYLDEPKGLWVTTDRASWTRLDDVGGTNDFHRQLFWLGRQALAADKVDGGVFYLMSGDARFFVSIDGGRTWEESALSPPCDETAVCQVVGQLRARPGVAGEVWAAVGNGGLYRTTDRGQGWSRVPGVDTVRALGFGAPLVDGGPTTAYLYGRVNGDPDEGLWRSVDDGSTWELIGRYPNGTYAQIHVVNGDLDLPGRVYVGFAGAGAVYGDPS